MQPDVGAQESDATVDAYYYVETAVGVKTGGFWVGGPELCV